MDSIAADSPLASFSFPRTGKRGVPQQFPRRLFEMLESETKMVEASDSCPRIIAWSDSGRAFRIYDSSNFATTVLPKYFRTKKFSSFQRNLNLYGFTKVRRGEDADMYAHPAFMRNKPEGLLHLRKISNARDEEKSRPARSVSPSSDTADPPSPRTPKKETSSCPEQPARPCNSSSAWDGVEVTKTPEPDSPSSVSCGGPDRGRLDLLAFALEQVVSTR